MRNLGYEGLRIITAGCLLLGSACATSAEPKPKSTDQTTTIEVRYGYPPVYLYCHHSFLTRDGINPTGQLIITGPDGTIITIHGDANGNPDEAVHSYHSYLYLNITTKSNTVILNGECLDGKADVSVTAPGLPYHPIPQG